MSWIRFAEAFTLLTFAFWACRAAYATGRFIGEQSLPGSVTVVMASLLMDLFTFTRQMDDLLGATHAFTVEFVFEDSVVTKP